MGKHLDRVALLVGQCCGRFARDGGGNDRVQMFDDEDISGPVLW